MFNQLIFLILTIFKYQTFDYIPNLKSHHIIEKDQLEQLLDKSKQNHPFFIAFYDEFDMDKKTIKFLSTFITVLETEFPSYLFYLYKYDISQIVKEKYYLHYYTLPKLKFFFGDEHKTYDGGLVKAHIKAWIQRQSIIMKKAQK